MNVTNCDEDKGDWGLRDDGPPVALAPFLTNCSDVVTLGIRPSIADYSEAELDLIRHSRCIFFPTIRYVRVLDAMGKRTFPNVTTHDYQRSRLLQLNLLKVLEYPTPKARAYYGRQKQRIIAEFELPLRLMGVRTGPGWEQHVESVAELAEATERWNPVIAMEGTRWEERIDLICVNAECIGVLRRLGREGRPDALEVASPDKPTASDLVERSQALLKSAHLDDIRLHWVRLGRTWLVEGLSAPPRRFAVPGGVLNRHEHIAKLVRAGAL